MVERQGGPRHTSAAPIADAGRLVRHDSDRPHDRAAFASGRASGATGLLPALRAESEHASVRVLAASLLTIGSKQKSRNAWAVANRLSPRVGLRGGTRNPSVCSGKTRVPTGFAAAGGAVDRMHGHRSATSI